LLAVEVTNCYHGYLDWGFHNDNKSHRIQITFTVKNNPHHPLQNPHSQYYRR
jgi:hypothetical protein